MRYCLSCMVFFLTLGIFASAYGFVDENRSKSDIKNIGQNELITRLPNGLTVYIIRDTRFPLALTRLYVHTGSANETLEQAGISHVLEHMVFKGTDHRPKGKVAKDVEALGGYLNAATSFDRTWYLTDMPAAHWKMGMDVVYDMAFKASLEASELESEKDVVISELQRGDDTPNHRLFEDLQVACLANTVYGRPIIGFEPQIRKVTSEALRAYRDHWYQPQNMQLIVAGDIEIASVLHYAEKLFGDMKNTSVLPKPELIDLEKAPAKERVSVRRGPWNKVYLGISFPAPALSDVRSIDLDVLSYLLAGDGTSRFEKRYKYDTQLVDSISVSNMNLARGGMLSLTAVLDEEKLPAFWDAITRDFASLKAEDFTTDSLGRAVFNIEDSMDRAGETLNGLVSWKSTVQFLLGGEMGEINMRNRLKNISYGQLNGAIQQWFNPDLARVRVLAPEKAKLPDFAMILEKNWPAKKSVQSQQAAYMNGAAETIELENGAKLILLPDTHVPYVSLHLTHSGGNALLNEKNQGLAYLTAALLSDGCAAYDTQAVEKYLAERASSLEVTSGLQTFFMKMEGPSKYTRDLLNLLNDIIAWPHFTQKEFERERMQMLAQIKSRDDNAVTYLFSKLWPSLYKNHCYGYDNLGSAETLKTLTVENVKSFWEQQKKQPWVLSVCGSFDKDLIVSFAKKWAGQKTVKKESVGVPMLSEQKNYTWSFAGRSQAHLLKLFPAVSLKHEDAPALMVLNSVLSGQSGLLFSSMRDKEGLGYTVTSFTRFMPEFGWFIFYIGTVPEKLELANQGFERVIGQVTKEPLDSALLKAGVNRLLGSYVRDNQSLASRAAEVSQNAILDQPLHFYKILLEKASHVTPEDLMRVAQKYLQLPSAYTATIKP